MRPLEAWRSFPDFTWTQKIAVKKKNHINVWGLFFEILTIMTLIFISSFNDWALFSFKIWKKDILLKSEHLGDFPFVFQPLYSDGDLFLNLNEELSPAIWILSLLYLSQNLKDCYYCQFEAFNRLSEKF